MMDEYSALDKFNSPGFITGKPIVLGGSQGVIVLLLLA